MLRYTLQNIYDNGHYQDNTCCYTLQNVYDNTGCLLRMWMNVRFYIPRVSIDGYQNYKTQENSNARKQMSQTR